MDDRTGNLKKRFDLTGRVAVITGGAGMLGGKHAEVISEAGGFPVLIDLNREAVRKAAAGLAQRCGRPVEGLAADITRKADVERAFRRVLTRHGRLDILINNAAMTVKQGARGGGNYFAPFEAYPLPLWEKALKINLTGAFLCCQAAGRAMVRRRRGVILNIASVAGVAAPDPRIYRGVKNPYTGKPFNTPVAYAATKAGLIQMTRYLAAYWGRKGIRVNALSPGGVDEGHGVRFTRQYSDRVPLGRMARKGDYQGAVLFMVSDASSYMTGANVLVDGGLTCW